MDALVRRLAVAIGILCGVVATQGPEYAQQYRQRLAGAIDELTRVVQAFDAEAAAQSLDPGAAIARLKANADVLARERGEDMEYDISRLARLRAALENFRDSGPWRRLVALVADFDPATAGLAWKDFEPAVPTTLELLGVGLVGLLWGWAATHACVWPVRRHFRRRRDALRPLARENAAT